MSKPDGGPAFPRTYFAVAQGENVTLDATHPEDVPAGMSLRDWFAGQVLGWVSREDRDMDCDFDTYVDFAYGLADAMIAKREK